MRTDFVFAHTPQPKTIRNIVDWVSDGCVWSPSVRRFAAILIFESFFFRGRTKIANTFTSNLKCAHTVKIEILFSSTAKGEEREPIEIAKQN